MRDHADPPNDLDRPPLIVDEASAGLRLDQYLVNVIPNLSRSTAQRLIRDGHARLADRAARPSAIVRLNDRVTVRLPPLKPSALVAEALPLDILHEDADLVVVNKPAGMVVHPAPGHAEGTLVNALLFHVSGLSGIGGEARPGVVHRLDRGTSGVLVIAKHDAAHAALSRQFKDRDVEKAYIALVWGDVQAGRRIEAAIGRDPADRKRMSTRARRSRTAVTRVTKAEHLKGVSLLHVTIATGRTHQIRVHLSAIGHPIVGDTLYGGVRRRVPPQLRATSRLARPFLHAARLAFAHPADGRRVEFSAPLPADLVDVLEELRHQAAGRGDAPRRPSATESP